MEINLPDNYSKLEDTLTSADKILTKAADDSKTLFHTMVVSSFDGDKISSRVMVLREFNLEERKMRFHTDYRAPKIQHFSNNSTATVLGYDPEIKIQIKLQGKITPHYNDESTKLAWDGSTPRSKKCYSVKGGSTKEIHDPKDFDIGDFEVEEGYKNFSVLIFSFDTLEFYILKAQATEGQFINGIMAMNQLGWFLN